MTMSSTNGLLIKQKSIIHLRAILSKSMSGHRKNSRAIIYTDGACSRNGQSDARAGIGVCWPNNPDHNISEPIEGRQTNQRAEIEAARRGIEQAKELGYKGVTVRTDSAYVKNAAESWIPNWERGNWSTPVVNKKEFKRLQESMKDYDVTFEHVPSRENAADPLARNGAVGTLARTYQ